MGFVGADPYAHSPCRNRHGIYRPCIIGTMVFLLCGADGSACVCGVPISLWSFFMEGSSCLSFTSFFCMRNLLITSDYPPHCGGVARYLASLVHQFPQSFQVWSTVVA